MNEQATLYAARGRKFLAQASEELARNDLPQASEKGWGAAAQIIKAVGAERDWPHEQHRHLYRIVHQLSEQFSTQLNQDDLRVPFALAAELHTNLYEDHFPKEEVALRLARVTTMVERVEAILRNGTAA